MTCNSVVKLGFLVASVERICLPMKMWVQSWIWKIPGSEAYLLHKSHGETLAGPTIGVGHGLVTKQQV